MLSLVAGWPLFFSFACFIPAFRSKACFLLPWAAVPAFVAVFLVPVGEVVEVPWFFMGGRMGLDETGRIFLCLSAFIWFLAGMSSVHLSGRERYSVFFLAAMAGNFGLILAQDALGYYVFFALMSFSAVGLVVHRGTPDTRKAGGVYLLLVMIGEMALFVSLLMLAGNTESMAIADITDDSSYNLGILLLLFIGFGVKVGVLPVHGWMPLAYQAAPVPAAAALSGAMVNAGLLGWLRFLPLGRIDSPRGALLFITAGGVAALYGVVAGLGQRKPGAVLGYSSISQMGLMTLVVGLGLSSPAAGEQAAAVLVLYAVHHSLSKSCLFFGYDVMTSRQGQLSGWSVAALLLPALSLAGLPFTSGAVAKTGLKELFHAVGEPWSSAASYFLPLTALGTTLLVLHFVQRACVRKSAPASRAVLVTKILVLIASLGAVAFAVWLWPQAKLQARHSLAISKIIHALWPVVLGSGIIFFWRRSEDKQEVYDDGYLACESRSHLNSLYMQVSKSWEMRLARLSKFFFAMLELLLKMLQLRKIEKILGRWTMVGVSYLVLCLLLLLLLR